MSHIVHHFLPFLAWVIFCLIGIASIAYIYWTFDELRQSNINSKEILSILKKPVSCDLPYGVQDQIEQTYKNITSATCE
jgi:hypothetical protein